MMTQMSGQTHFLGVCALTLPKSSDPKVTFGCVFVCLKTSGTVEMRMSRD